MKHPKPIETVRAPNPRTRREILRLRLSSEELAEIQALADKHAGGNISAYVRHAARTWKKENAR